MALSGLQVYAVAQTNCKVGVFPPVWPCDAAGGGKVETRSARCESRTGGRAEQANTSADHGGVGERAVTVGEDRHVQHGRFTRSAWRCCWTIPFDND